MDWIFTYGIAELIVCFTIGMFCLARIPVDSSPRNYMFRYDPFFYIVPLLLLGGVSGYLLCPTQVDWVKNYGILDFILPVVFAFIIYMFYLLDFVGTANILTFIASLIISYMQPDDFQPFAPYLTPVLSKLAVACLLFLVSKGFGILNGLGGIASLEFCAVMVVTIILVYINLLPVLLGIIAFAYIGAMTSFLFLSWPPEKVIMSNDGFNAIGFILGCFMINVSAEFLGASMLIACSYLFIELGIVFYNRVICNEKKEQAFMSTSYYTISQDGTYEQQMVNGVLKIIIVDVIIAVVQTIAQNQFSMIFFALAVNLWFLSIYAGKTKVQNLFFTTTLGKKALSSLKKKKKD